MDFNRDAWIAMNFLMTNLLIEFFLFEICTLYEIVIMTMTSGRMRWWKCHVGGSKGGVLVAKIIIWVEIVAVAWCGVWWRSRGGVVMTMVEVAVMIKVVSMVVMVVVTTTLKRWS